MFNKEGSVSDYGQSIQNPKWRTSKVQVERRFSHADEVEQYFETKASTPSLCTSAIPVVGDRVSDRVRWGRKEGRMVKDNGKLFSHGLAYKITEWVLPLAGTQMREDYICLTVGIICGRCPFRVVNTKNTIKIFSR